MESALNKLIILQFAIYTTIGLLVFISWLLAFTDNISILKGIIGEYFYGHIMRWSMKFAPWGVLMLISAILSLGATHLLRYSRKEGAYLGIISFSIGFATNILFAQNILVHTLIVILIGWTLLAPLAVTWEKLKTKDKAAS